MVLCNIFCNKIYWRGIKLKVKEEVFEVECMKIGKTDTETAESDSTTYKADFLYKKEDEFVRISVSSSEPLKAQVGEKVKFTKTNVQATILESLEDKKDKKKDDSGKVSGSSKSSAK